MSPPQSYPVCDPPWPGRLLGCAGLLVCPGLSRPAGIAQGLGKSQIAKPVRGLQSHLGGLCVFTSLPSCPSGQCLSPRPQESPADKASGQPYLSLLACRPGVVCLACQYLLPPYVLRVLWARWPALCPRAWCHHLSRPSLDPARTTVGPSSAPLEPSPLPPPHPTPPSPVRPGPRMHRSLSLLLLF